jgi:hypothetical protein
MLLQRLPRRTSRTCLKTHLTLHGTGPSGPVSIVNLLAPDDLKTDDLFKNARTDSTPCSA